MGNRLRDYLWAAFNAKPLGMPVPPNWIALAAMGTLGFLNPGFWILGSGLEGAYLLACITSPRFRAIVDGRGRVERQKEAQVRFGRVFSSLPDRERARFQDLDARCARAIADARASGSEALTELQGQSLSAFRWAYLQLLAMRSSVQRVLEDAKGRGEHAPNLLDRIEALTHRLTTESLPDPLKESLSAQRDVLQQRLAAQNEAAEKIQHIDSELARIENHVDLVREQALLTGDPDAAGDRITRAAASLEGTTRWIREQSSLSPMVGETLDDDPPALEVERN
jgi:hypothetical protein